MTVSDAHLAEAVRARNGVRWPSIVASRSPGGSSAYSTPFEFGVGASLRNQVASASARTAPIGVAWTRVIIATRSARTASALLEARALGLEIAALSADPLGVGLYRKFGFREVSRHLTYVWSPER